MDKTVRILFVEDFEDDALLIARRLGQHGLITDYDIVDTEKGMLAALETKSYEAVLCDYNVPSFGADRALVVLRSVAPDLPVIVVSGSIGEERAADLMHAGARDIVMKSNLTRLAPAVEREIKAREAAVSLRRRADQTERHFANLVERSFQGIIIRADFKTLFVNDAMCRMFGYTLDEMNDVKSMLELVHPDDHARVAAHITEQLTGIEETRRFDAMGMRKDKSHIWLEVMVSNVAWFGSQAVQIVVIDISERKNAEQSVQAREKKYRELFESAPVAMFRSTQGRKFLDVNQALESLLGYSHSELLGIGPIDLIPPEDVENVTQAVMRLWNGEAERAEIVHRIRRKDGAIIWVNSSACRLIDESGAPYVFSHFQDVTGRVKAEQALADSEREYRETFEDAPIAMAWVGTDRYYQRTNRALQELFGYTAEELSVMRPMDTIHEYQHDASRPSLADLLAGKSSHVVMEDRHVRKDGRLIWLLINLVAIRGDDGNAKFVLSHLQDITGMKEAEHALAESEQQYREIFENAPISMAWVGIDRSYMRTNRACQELYGYSAEELLTMRTTDVIDPKYRQVGRLADLVAGKSERAVFENRHRRKDGSTIWVLSNVAAIRDEEGVTRFLLVHQQDITARKNAEEQLFQAQKMEAIGNFAGGIAHDFNNMLQPIIGLTEMTRDDLPAADPLRENLDMVLDAAKQASQLVQQILTFSRQDESEISDVDISSCVANAVRLLSNVLPTTIRIVDLVSRDLGIVRADAAQLQSVILNLGANAAHAIGGQIGEIKIGLDRMVVDGDRPAALTGLAMGDYVKITLADTGSGMDEATLAKIFNPFFTTKAPGEGTGLGLSMVHGIVERLGGVIGVESEVGVGTTFKIYLPLSKRADI